LINVDYSSSEKQSLYCNDIFQSGHNHITKYQGRLTLCPLCNNNRDGIAQVQMARCLHIVLK